jgi:tetratricopeptide (TPR) repeat protein
MKGSVMSRAGSRADSESALYEAQELIYDAWEADDVEKSIALAKKALTISPLCADAYVLLAGHEKRGSPEQIALFQKGVEAGTKAIGAANFRDMEGDFWGFIETRPYMRSRQGLAMALWVHGERGEAIDHLRDMLRLNPDDNQGLRYVLAGWFIEENRDDDLDALLKAYEDDGAAAWAWGAALAAFRRHGDNAESRRLLKDAIKVNKHVRPYLLGDKKLPKKLPPYMGFGDASEAVWYVSECKRGWDATPGAIDWVRSYVAAPPRKAQRSSQKS